MLRILGSNKMACDGLSRREMLQAGSLGTLSLTLPLLLRLQSAQAAADSERRPATFGRAKRIILLYLYGAAAQHETFDPKPDAPLEIRGKFRPIETAVPGLSICEHLPRIARIADRLTVIRSMSHPYNIHSAAYTLTGVDKVDIPMELNPYDRRHWPFFGSVLDYLAQKSAPHEPPKVPRNLLLPFRFSSRCGEFKRGGPYGGFLGRAFDPVCAEFDGRATRKVARWRGNADQAVDDPYVGIHPDDRLRLSQAAQLGPQMTLDRLDRRRGLLAQLDQERRALERSSATASMDRFREMAYSLIASGTIRDALDVGKESAELRERYGMTLFGQSALAGRRLLEAGATLVTVMWDEVTTANSAWDTHFNHYERLQHELLPGLDQALSALVLDLEDRGLLDDTLVMCLTEHGRTPKLTEKERGVGREHWSNTYCNVLAGGGIARGNVIGQSDENGAFVKDAPVSPKDLLCTMYHLLGVDPRTHLYDTLNRPLPLVSEGDVLHAALG